MHHESSANLDANLLCKPWLDDQNIVMRFMTSKIEGDKTPIDTCQDLWTKIQLEHCLLTNVARVNKQQFMSLILPRTVDPHSTWALFAYECITSERTMSLRRSDKFTSKTLCARTKLSMTLVFAWSGDQNNSSMCTVFAVTIWEWLRSSTITKGNCLWAVRQHSGLKHCEFFFFFCRSFCEDGTWNFDHWNIILVKSTQRQYDTDL